MNHQIKIVCFLFLFISKSFANSETLILGDSHVVGSFGENLHSYFSAQAKTRTVGLAGASGASFSSINTAQRTLSYGFADRTGQNEIRINAGKKATGPVLSELLTKENPQTVIIELGDNFADYKSPQQQSDQFATHQIQMILDQLAKANSKAKCYWVTPIWTDKSGKAPFFKKNDRLLKVISLIKKTAEPRCTVIDSTQDIGIQKNQISTGPDGLHFDAINGKKWAEAVGKRIQFLENESQINAKNINQSAIPAKRKAIEVSR